MKTISIIVQHLKEVLESYPELSYHTCYLTKVKKVFILELAVKDNSHFDLYRQGKALAKWIGEGFLYKRYDLAYLKNGRIMIEYIAADDTEYDLFETAS